MGLGTLVTALVVSSSLDITGIVAAGTLAIVGFFVIPYKRKQAKDSFKEKMKNLRTNLLETLTTSFNREAQSAVARLKDGHYAIHSLCSHRTRADRQERNDSGKIAPATLHTRARSQAVVGSKNS